MHKYFHRAITAIVIFIAFFSLNVIFSKFELIFFVQFLLVAPAIALIFVFLQKMPMRCDQDACEGVCMPEYSASIQNVVLTHLLIKGHRCSRCGHLIKIPKGRRRSFS